MQGGRCRPGGEGGGAGRRGHAAEGEGCIWRRALKAGLGMMGTVGIMNQR